MGFVKPHLAYHDLAEGMPVSISKQAFQCRGGNLDVAVFNGPEILSAQDVNFGMNGKQILNDGSFMEFQDMEVKKHCINWELL